MKYQADFKKLIKKLKPENFGAVEYFVQTQDAGPNCTLKPIAPESAEELTKVAAAANASVQFLSDYERDIKCIMVSQSRFPDKHEGEGFSYGNCRSANDLNSQKGARGYRPCRTRENAEAMMLSLKLVANCTGLKEADMFPLLQHEGGLNLNVMSGTGAAGVGQMTAIAIESLKSGGDAYEQVDDAILKGKYSSKLPGMSCDLLKPYTKMFPKNSRSDCEMMSPPKNPILSLMLAAKLFRYNHSEFDQLVESMTELYRLDKPNKKGVAVLDQAARMKLVRAMYLWSYNGGLNGIRSQFKDFMYQTFMRKRAFEYGKPVAKQVTRKTKKGTQKITIMQYPTQKPAEATVDDLISGMEVTLAKRYPGTAKRKKEASRYYAAIERDLNRTNLKVGGHCFGSEPLDVPGEEESDEGQP